MYLVLWITDFARKGVLQDNDEAKTVYKNIMVLGVIATAICLPLIGKMVDLIPASIFVPVSFLIRGVLIYQFEVIQDPRSNVSTVICVAVILASSLQFISIHTYFMRSLPNAIRGTMLGVYNLFANFGIAAFTLAGGIMFDDIGPSAPFTLVSICDLAIFVLAIGLFCCRDSENKG